MQDIVVSSSASARTPVVQVHVGASKHVHLSSARLGSVASLFHAAGEAVATPRPAPAETRRTAHAPLAPRDEPARTATGKPAHESLQRDCAKEDAPRADAKRPCARRLDLDEPVELDLAPHAIDACVTAEARAHAARSAHELPWEAGIVAPPEAVSREQVAVQVDMTQVLCALRDGFVCAEDLTGLARGLQKSVVHS
jgi:hypothetical protein